jgi:hypothetical protein
MHRLVLDSTVELAGSGDFMVNGSYSFEVGGKKKGFKQIAGLEHAYVAADDLEIGFKNKLLLWLFVLLY